MSDRLSPADTLDILGTARPVDVALTERVATVRAERVPHCTHTRQTIKQGDVFLVTHTDGQVHPACECGQGLYFRDTRFLSGFRVTLAGRAPIVLASSAEHNFFARVEAMNDVFELPDGTKVKRESMHVGRTLLIDGGVREAIEVRNYNAFGVETTLALELRADYKDIFEVRGSFSKPAPGTYMQPLVGDASVELLYRGADAVVRHTRLGFSKAPTRVTPRSWPETHETGVVVEWDLSLSAKGGAWTVGVSVEPALDGADHAELPGEPVGMRQLEAMHAAAEASMTRISSPHHRYETFFRRGQADLLMLCSPGPDGAYPTAGIPWYACPFGRDSLITAYQTLMLDPAIAVATLRFLARLQGTLDDPSREEEPGKILHEMRRGELAELRAIPFSTYYGTIDATPLWLVLLSETYRWTGDLGLVRELWPNALAALEWLDRCGDADGDGFVEYARKENKGLTNQGWKDSFDSVIHPDSTLAAAPIALVEVQGYAYDAKRRMAELARLLGEQDLASRLEAEAGALKTRFNEAFWEAEGGYYAIALDGAKQRVRAKTSNPGHALWSGIIADDRVEGLAASMLAPDMFNGWGIRTMSADAPNYNPLSYHNGTVWPHDTSLVAKGLADHGFKAEANRVFEALFDTAQHFPYARLPELFCGFEREGRLSKPVPYPVACSPQAWAAGTPMLLLAGALGLEPDAASRTLRLRRPTLPPSLPEIRLEGLRVGAAEADLHFVNEGGRTRVVVEAVRGELRVEVIE